MSIIYSHGDKGGVGKSLVSAVYVDYLLQSGKPASVIEGDASQPDIALRYHDLIEKRGVNLNRSGAAEEAVMAFTNAIAELGEGDILVNLPAGAGDTLEELAEVLVGAAEELGHESYVLYSLGHSELATKAAIKSIDCGLLGAVAPEHRCMVYPAFLGSPDNFDWVRSGAREKYQIREIVIPAIKPEALAQKVLSLRGSFESLTGKESPLTIGERLIFQKKFLIPALEAVAIFDK